VKVRLKIRVRLSDGTYPFLDPVESANRKLKPFYAVVHGKPGYHPEGTYFLRYARDGTRMWENGGKDPQLAVIAKQRRAKAPEAQAVGVEIVTDALAPEKRTLLAEAVAEYLAEVKAGKAPRTFWRIPSHLNSSSKPLTKALWKPSTARTCPPSLLQCGKTGTAPALLQTALPA
jgi:hypothetical protein